MCVCVAAAAVTAAAAAEEEEEEEEGIAVVEIAVVVAVLADIELVLTQFSSTLLWCKIILSVVVMAALVVVPCTVLNMLIRSFGWIVRVYCCCCCCC